MKDSTVSKVLSFTLLARDLLESEASEQLEGLYGWLPDGTLASEDHYPAIKKNKDARTTRVKIEQYISDEREAGIKVIDARKRFIREVAFTWLNRLVAFRLMEERGLIRKGTIAAPEKSTGFKMWVAEPGNAAMLKLYEAGDHPANEIGEGPRQEAFRRYILSICNTLAKEIRVLFDSANLPSRMFPRPKIIVELIEMMNESELSEAWAPGNEETIGWVYQGFQARELQEAFQRVSESKKKFEAADIPAVTQLFTPRWVVRYIVENSLGRLWLEMHHDTELTSSWAYLVPKELDQKIPLKSVKDIKLLDPACGSMHFGLIAFDLFVEMYREEIKNAGKPGWPKEPPVKSEDEIPLTILTNNIYGIDIDIRALQLSALTLYLRAKGVSKTAVIKDSRLACAGIHMLDGERLNKFVAETASKGELFKRIFAALQEELKDSEQLGSLLRLEDTIPAIIDKAKTKSAERKELISQTIDLFEEGHEQRLDDLRFEAEEALHAFASHQAEKGIDQAFFVEESTHGLRLLEILSQKYDVVVTNPPYMSRRKMNERLKKLLGDQYPDSSGDLYAAFIQRCLELTNDGGRVGMLTMHSFMFISSYEGLREYLCKLVAIETLNHYGGGLFAVGNPGTLQTAAFVLRSEAEKEKREKSEGVYLRLVHEVDANSKRRAFEAALGALKEGRPHPLVFQYAQKVFDGIPGKPWVYWFSRGVRELFLKCRLMRSVSSSSGGMTTSKNERFVCFCWEVPRDRVTSCINSREEAIRSGRRWFPYLKGGAGVKWIGKGNYVVNWEKDGAEIKASPSFPRSEAFYFKPGLCWSDVDSTGFAARIAPQGAIFDATNLYSAAPPEMAKELLGVLNSSIALYVLSGLNPTIHYQVGDIERLPIPKERSLKIAELVNQCVELARQDSRESEATYDFVCPLRDIAEYEERKAKRTKIESEIDAEVSRLYGLTEENLAEIDRELSVLSYAGGAEEEGATGEEEDGAEKLEISAKSWAQNWITYAVGIALGRFEIGVKGGLGCGDFSKDVAAGLQKLSSHDGILVSDANHERDIILRVWKALVLMLGEAKAKETIVAAFGDGLPEEVLRAWFDRFTGQAADSFWRRHVQLYRKRPVYWPFQSPNKLFTVWVFHERMTKDTLFHIRSDIIAPKLRWLDSRIKELKAKGENAEGRERRRVEQALAEMDEMHADLKKFSENIKRVADEGYAPHIDDGVLINMTPLWELVPSWQTELKKAWEKLESGEFDWAQQAMEYWPDRVKEKCKSNKSYAIAHNMEGLYEEPKREASETGKHSGKKVRAK